MFTIIGGDGREYGPVSADKVRGWIAAGRADLSTQAKAEGTIEWKPLGDYPEFAGGPAAMPPPLTADGPAADLASPLERLGAWLLDSLLTFVAVLPGMLMIGPEMMGRIMRREIQDADELAQLGGGLAVLLLGAGVIALLQAVLLSARGQSVGKMLCRIRIVRFGDGSNPGFFRAVLARQWLIGFVEAVPYFGTLFFLVDSLFIFSPGRRCLHDLLADTRVVRVPRVRNPEP
ncbi:MAG TPA: RDD family protein [Opitutaceae bacterium]|nr:RDD family protein [Opitutaceae bacterium]